jgi:hypothetical protein
MAMTNIYDIEICIEGRKLQVIPYKLEVSVDGHFSGDYSSEGQGKVFSVSMRPENAEVVDYILEVDNTLRRHWDGFSEWDTTERFYRDRDHSKMPEKLKKWLQALPTYEIKIAP